MVGTGIDSYPKPLEPLTNDGAYYGREMRANVRRSTANLRVCKCRRWKRQTSCSIRRGGVTLRS